jgi:hypothetical protein
MLWIVVVLAAGSLVISLTTLYVMLGVGRSTIRAQRAGDERLEILREQQQRLQLLREERQMLEEELEWRRTMMNSEERQERQLKLNAPSEPSEANGQGQSKQPKPGAWLRSIIGR